MRQISEQEVLKRTNLACWVYLQQVFFIRVWNMFINFLNQQFYNNFQQSLYHLYKSMLSLLYLIFYCHLLLS